MPKSQSNSEYSHLRLVNEDYLAELRDEDEVSRGSVAKMVAAMGYMSVLGAVEIAERFCPLRIASKLWCR